MLTPSATVTQNSLPISRTDSTGADRRTSTPSEINAACDQPPGICVVVGQDTIKGLNQGDLGSESLASLRYFTSHRAAADHDQPGRERIQLPERFIREKRRVFEAGDGRDEWRCAGTNEKGFRGYGSPSGGNGSVAGKFGMTFHYVYSFITQGVWRFRRIDLSYHIPDAGHHSGEIDGRRRCGDTGVAGVSDRVGDAGGVEQGFAGDATGPGAVSAHPVGLDQHRARLPRRLAKRAAVIPAEPAPMMARSYFSATALPTRLPALIRHCENLPLILSPSKDHPELVEGRGNLDDAEHMPTNRRCYGDEIANPRIEYGGAMTK